MAEPFVFHFRRGETGQPEQMYLADIRAECAVCRHVQVQRYYHSTPLHTATVGTLRQLAGSVHTKTEFDCPNCGEPVGPTEALSTAFTWAFPDEAALVQAFVPNARDLESLRWQFRHRRLDPQELPGWEPDLAEPVFTQLDDELIEEHCGRVTSPKAAIREVLREWLEDPEGGAVGTISRDMSVIAISDDATLEDLIEDDRQIVPLDDCVPHGLATHHDPASMTGALSGWLGADIDRSKIFLAIDASNVDPVISRAFEVANLSYARTESGYEQITTPRDSEYPRALTTQSVLRRAVYTGLTPGDAARLTAEEIVGNLLRVW